jgi:hypothetical protein
MYERTPNGEQGLGVALLVILVTITVIITNFGG